MVSIVKTLNVQILETNPSPETTEFLQNTLPTIIHSLQEDPTRKRSA